MILKIEICNAIFFLIMKILSLKAVYVYADLAMISGLDSRTFVEV